MLGALIVWWPASFWLQWTMAEGTVHTGSPGKFLTKPTEEWKYNRKMYALKQIKICAEYRDMLPRPRLDLSGTPGLRPISLNPGSWQTNLGLGSMSRYSAQILICITCTDEQIFCVNTLRPRQNGLHFADDIFERIFVNENVRISVTIPLKFIPNVPINNISALVQIMAWRRPGDKPLSESIMIRLPTYICATRPQWASSTIFFLATWSCFGI